MSKTVTINLEARGEKGCKQVIKMNDNVEEKDIILLVKHIAKKDIMLRGKDYFINQF